MVISIDLDNLIITPHPEYEDINITSTLSWKCTKRNSDPTHTHTLVRMLFCLKSYMKIFHLRFVLFFVSLVPPHQYQVLRTYLSSQRPRSDFTLMQRSDQDLKGFTFSSKLFSAAVTSKMQIAICNNSHQLWHQINWRNVQLQKCFKLWCKRCFSSSWLPYSGDK